MKRIILLFLFSMHLCADEKEPEVEMVLSIQLTVSDMEQSIRFYTQVLQFQLVSDVQTDQGKSYDRFAHLKNVEVRVAQLKLGDEFLILKQFIHPKGRHAPKKSKINDFIYQHIAIVVSDLKVDFRAIHSQHVRFILTSPQVLPDSNSTVAGIGEFYFRDPDGHPIAIIEYPSDKERRKWQKETDSIFLGIDHTAFVVKNTEISLNLYRDILGFKVLNTSLQ